MGDVVANLMNHLTDIGDEVWDRIGIKDPASPEISFVSARLLPKPFLGELTAIKLRTSALRTC